MKFAIWRESDAYANPPTAFKELTSVHVSTAYDSFTEWIIEIKDMAELKALQRHERDNYTPTFSKPEPTDKGVRLEIAFGVSHNADGVITILDKDAGRYSGMR